MSKNLNSPLSSLEIKVRYNAFLIQKAIPKKRHAYFIASGYDIIQIFVII